MPANSAMRDRRRTRRRRLWIASGFVVLVAIHVLVVSEIQGPTVFRDETGYLFTARYLAGVGPTPTMGIAPLYHIGYSLVLVPGFLLFDDPVAAYRFGLLMNSLLLSSIFPLSYVLARKLFDAAPWQAGLAAFAAALYPPFILQAQFAWSESLFIPLSLVFTLALHRLGSSRSALAACAAAVAAVALYAVHGRGLPIVAATALWLAICWWRRVLRLEVVATAALTIVVGFVTVRGVHEFVKAVIWVPGRRAIEAKVFEWLTNFWNWDNVLIEGVGQVWYLVAGTLGLFLLGVGVLLQRAWHDRAKGLQHPAVFTALGMVFICAAVLFVAAATTTFPVRADHYVYGRYNEGFLAPFLLAGCIGLLRHRIGWRHLTIGLLALVGLGLATALRQERITEAISVDLNVLALTPAIHWFRGIRVLPTCALVAAAMIAVGAAVWIRRDVGVVVVGALFLAATAGGFAWSTRPLNQGIVRKSQLPVAIERFGPVHRLAYDQDYFNWFGFYPYQFYLDETRFTFFRGSRDLPPETLVVSGRLSPRIQRLGARPAYMEFDTDQALWVMPGRRQDALASRGLLLPADYPSRLPDAAMRSRIDVSGPKRGELVLMPDEQRTIELEVTHVGSGSPWPALFSTPEPRGVVRLRAEWVDERGRRYAGALSDLPRFVYPGETVHPTIQLGPMLPSGELLRPGTYSVVIGLMQEGFRLDRLEDDEGLTLQVRIKRTSS